VTWEFPPPLHSEVSFSSPGALDMVFGLLADTSVDLVTTLQAVWLVGAAVTVLPLPARQCDDVYLSQLSRVIMDARLGLVVVGHPLQAFARRLAALTPTAALAVPWLKIPRMAAAIRHRQSVILRLHDAMTSSSH